MESRFQAIPCGTRMPVLDVGTERSGHIPKGDVRHFLHNRFIKALYEDTVKGHEVIAISGQA